MKEWGVPLADARLVPVAVATRVVRMIGDEARVVSVQEAERAVVNGQPKHAEVICGEPWCACKIPRAIINK
jgi:hypothetical protein